MMEGRKVKGKKLRADEMHLQDVCRYLANWLPISIYTKNAFHLRRYLSLLPLRNLQHTTLPKKACIPCPSAQGCASRQADTEERRTAKTPCTPLDPSSRQTNVSSRPGRVCLLPNERCQGRGYVRRQRPSEP